MQRMLRAALIVATFCALGCPSHGPEPTPSSVADVAVRIAVARAEARGGSGAPELVELAQPSHDAHARELALRGLGRIGGGQAREALVEASRDRDLDVVAAALGGLGVLASLDEPSDIASIGAGIADALQRCDAHCRPAGLEALGRAGGSDQEPVLVAALADPHVATTAAFALGRYGRRKLALSIEAERALVHASSSTDRELRYAAVYAISRMVVGEEHPPTTAALVSVLGDPDPEIRATAIAGIARRKQVAAAHAPIEYGLSDSDWRVQIEAVRALAGDNGDDPGRALVAVQLPALLDRAIVRDGAATHVAIEALRQLVAHPPADAAAVTAVAASMNSLQLAKLSPRSRGWIETLLLAAAERATNDNRFDPAAIDPADLPQPYVLGVAADLALHRPLAARRTLLHAMLGNRDSRVKAAALPLVASMWKDSDADDHRAMIGMFASAIADKDAVVAGAAADAVEDLYTAIGDGPEHAALDAAIVARATTERDPELASGLLELIGKHAIASGLGACKASLVGHPVVARAAAECLKALGQPGEAPELHGATAPAGIDVASVIGMRVRWHLVTSRGAIDIELLPDVAPWNVATIVALTQRHFYDGLDFHRVVPDFVVQGGDPTMSGEGGPGFTTPAEPATLLDGDGFVTGGIGMADAGRDSAGSQWFAMHSRAPHLDGRYTWVGQVVSGQNVVDSLLIGDRVETATIEIQRK